MFPRRHSAAAATPGQPKVVAITGASAGLGETLALQLAERGNFKLALIARTADKLKAVVEKCGGEDVAIAVVADVTKRDDIKNAVTTILARFGTIDVWVNNAGRGCWVPPSTVTEEVMYDMVRINVLSALYGMQEVLPVFVKKGYGQIINVSSLLGRMAGIGASFSAYSGSKYFLNGMTDAMRAENIVFTTVSPGGMMTDFGTSAQGPDMRKMPGSQDTKDVAYAIIKEGIVERRQEVYTAKEHKAMMRKHLASLVPK